MECKSGVGVGALESPPPLGPISSVKGQPVKGPLTLGKLNESQNRTWGISPTRSPLHPLLVYNWPLFLSSSPAGPSIGPLPVQPDTYGWSFPVSTQRRFFVPSTLDPSGALTSKSAFFFMYKQVLFPLLCAPLRKITRDIQTVEQDAVRFPLLVLTHLKMFSP